jgi:acyl transferase domain-containing protein
VILESYTKSDAIICDRNSIHNVTALQNGVGSPKPELLLFSANTASSLSEQIRRDQDWVRLNPALHSDMAYTRAFHREHLPHRAFSILDDGSFIQSAPGLKAPQGTPTVVMVFSGQGAQWPEMGKELILGDPDFRCDILNMDQKLKDLIYPPHWNMIGEQSQLLQRTI